MHRGLRGVRPMPARPPRLALLAVVGLAAAAAAPAAPADPPAAPADGTPPPRRGPANLKDPEEAYEFLMPTFRKFRAQGGRGNTEAMRKFGRSFIQPCGLDPAIIDCEYTIQGANLSVGQEGMVTFLRKEAAAEEVPAPVSEERIRAWVAALGESDYDAREAATKGLREAGVAALPLLKQAAQADDPEVQARAEQLVAEIGKRVADRSRAAFQDAAMGYLLVEGRFDPDTASAVAALVPRFQGTDAGWDWLSAYLYHAARARGGDPAGEAFPFAEGLVILLERPAATPKQRKDAARRLGKLAKRPPDEDPKPWRAWLEERRPKPAPEPLAPDKPAPEKPAAEAPSAPPPSVPAPPAP